MTRATNQPRDGLGEPAKFAESLQSPSGSGIERIPWWGLCLILGLYLTLRGYHCLDGDQAYRLPLLLRQLDPSLYVNDPFVRAFDAFNPHRGSLLILSTATRLAGLCGGLLLLFLMTFMATCRGIQKLANAVWPSLNGVGWVAIGLVLTAKAGNIGTNHLFEAMVLDRLMALALGWLAIALFIGQPPAKRMDGESEGPHARFRQTALAAGLIGAAALIHPSMGLQLAMLIAGSCVAWAILGSMTGVSWRGAIINAVAVLVAVLPGIAFNMSQGGSINAGMNQDDLWALSVELQSPQHMLPHLWRMPQWLGFASYFALAGLTLLRLTKSSAATERPLTEPYAGSLVRLSLMLVAALVWLGASWVAIEGMRHLSITMFQPFRMATVARGLALILIAGWLAGLWRRGDGFSRFRAAMVAVGLTGDWTLVVVTVAECATEFAAWLHEGRWWSLARIVIRPMVVYVVTLAFGLGFLARHDTASGHLVLLPVILASVVLGVISSRRPLRIGTPDFWLGNPARRRRLMAFAWTVPVLAIFAALPPTDSTLARSAPVRSLVDRCRFFATPVDDMERLSDWCRLHTPASATFIGPPGPKAFRLWSRRSLAFNRAGSPYHAAGLADWYARFQDHVDVSLPPAEFARAYQTGRHKLESRYDDLSDEQLARLALRQGADHLVTAAPSVQAGTGQVRQGPLELLHVEGGYAVYRLRGERLSQEVRQP